MIQYNTDIPFENQAAPGFYNTLEGKSRTTAAPVGQSLWHLDNKHEPEDEDTKCESASAELLKVRVETSFIRPS